MKKKIVPIILVIFFLAQGLPLHSSNAEIYPLNPPSKVNENYPDLPFMQLVEAWQQALFIYKLDACIGLSKEVIIRDYSGRLRYSEAQFDWDNMGLRRKGWTRIYPFSISGKEYLARVFLREERRYQPPVEPVLFEATVTVSNADITVQILPNLATILKDCRIKPNRLYSGHEAAVCP